MVGGWDWIAGVVGPPAVPGGRLSIGRSEGGTFVAIFSATKVFTWIGTLYRGSITFNTPMLYFFAFVYCSRSAA